MANRSKTEVKRVSKRGLQNLVIKMKRRQTQWEGCKCLLCGSGIKPGDFAFYGEVNRWIHEYCRKSVLTTTRRKQ